MKAKNDKSKENASEELEMDASTAPVRKSTRIKQNSKFEQRMSMFVMNSKKGSVSENDDDEEDDEDDDDEEESDSEKMEVKRPRMLESTVNDVKQEDSDAGGDGKTPKSPKKNNKRQNEKSASTENKTAPVKRPKKAPTPDSKDELASEEDVDDPEPVEDNPKEEDFNPAMLNLMRVGDQLPKKSSTVSLNARGMPQRIRKKNRLFFGDNVVNIPGKRVKSNKVSAEKKHKKVDDDIDKEKVAEKIIVNKDDPGAHHRIGLKLRNILKLPKAQRWAFSEFFYSNIDSVLFFGTNDFVLCLDETFGHLRTMSLTRKDWCVLRRLMGKPRRCSQNFFKEERQTLERRRDVIRLIQQRKIKDASQIKDLPDKIPLQLRVNARVHAKLRYPQSGLFMGKVDAVDPSNNTYRITFDRPGIGTHSVPDYDVLLEGEPDMVSIMAMQKRYQSVRYSQPRPSRSYSQQHYVLPDGKDAHQVWKENMKNASFPLKFYETMIRICKILKEKKLIVEAISSMNGEAEKMILWNEPYPAFFQRRYAELLIDLESLNRSLHKRLTLVRKYCKDIAPDICESVMFAPTYLREKHIADAKATVKTYFNIRPPLKNASTANLVVELVSLVLQLENLAKPKPTTQERFVLKQTLQTIKSMISPENLLLFQNLVEVHVKYIEATFCDDPLAPLLVAPSTSIKSITAAHATNNNSPIKDKETAEG